MPGRQALGQFALRARRYDGAQRPDGPTLNVQGGLIDDHGAQFLGRGLDFDVRDVCQAICEADQK